MKVKNQVTVGEVCSWKDCSFSKEGIDFPKRVTQPSGRKDQIPTSFCRAGPCARVTSTRAEAPGLHKKKAGRVTAPSRKVELCNHPARAEASDL